MDKMSRFWIVHVCGGLFPLPVSLQRAPLPSIFHSDEHILMTGIATLILVSWTAWWRITSSLRCDLCDDHRFVEAYGMEQFEWIAELFLNISSFSCTCVLQLTKACWANVTLSSDTLYWWANNFSSPSSYVSCIMASISLFGNSDSCSFCPLWSGVQLKWIFFTSSPCCSVCVWVR